jgi:hypothetical protein
MKRYFARTETQFREQTWNAGDELPNWLIDDEAPWLLAKGFVTVIEEPDPDPEPDGEEV